MTTKSSNCASRINSAARLLIATVITILTLRAIVQAQTFNSGSDGSDGALTVPANSGTIVFDPHDTSRWGKVLNPKGDGVYNFTTITIGSGSTLRLRSDKVNLPLYWLVSGDVSISGTLNLAGADGSQTTDL